MQNVKRITIFEWHIVMSSCVRISTKAYFYTVGCTAFFLFATLELLNSTFLSFLVQVSSLPTALTMNAFKFFTLFATQVNATIEFVANAAERVRVCCRHTCVGVFEYMAGGVSVCVYHCLA